MKNKPLPPQSLKTWEYIAAFWQKNRYMPSVREIGHGTDRGVASVKYQLKTLQARGVIRVVPNISRGIVLLKQPPKAS